MVHAFHGSALRALLKNLCIYFMSVGIMCLGVGFKLLLKYSYSEYQRSNAWMLVAGFSATFFWSALSQFTDVFEVPQGASAIYNPSYSYDWGRLRRWGVYGLKIVLALAVLPLALLVDTSRDQGGNVVGGIGAPELLMILLFVALVHLVVTTLTRPTRIEKQLICCMHQGLSLLGPPLHRMITRRVVSGARTGGVEPTLATISSEYGGLVRKVSKVSTAGEIANGESMEQRRGKELWQMLRDHVNTWRYSQRVARMFSTHSGNTLQCPGDLRISSIKNDLPGLGAPLEENTFNGPRERRVSNPQLHPFVRVQRRHYLDRISEHQETQISLV